MLQVFTYDENGFYLSSSFVDELGPNMTIVPILVGRVKPKFDSKVNEWVEGANKEEIKEWESKQSKSQPTDTEQLKAEIDFGQMVMAHQQSEIDYLKMFMEV